MVSFVDALRAAVSAGSSLSLDHLEIGSANNVIIGDDETNKYNLKSPSGVKGAQEDEEYDVLAVYFAWVERDASVTDYIAHCDNEKIKVITLLEKTELISYIKGEIDECPYIVNNSDEGGVVVKDKAVEGAESTLKEVTLEKVTKDTSSEETKRVESTSKRTASASAAAAAASAAAPGGDDAEKVDYKEIKRQKIEQDPLLKSISEHEVELIDHDRALRGTQKSNDFTNLIRECEYKIIRPLKASASGKKASQSAKKSSTNGSKSAAAKASGTSSGSVVSDTPLSTILHKKDPIIILSPSAIAMLTMQNVKSFLQNGKFIDPQEAAALQNGDHANNIIHVIRESKRFNKKIKFVIVSNVEKFFVKPQYWDRVVAVFTTGQEWQFKNYQINQPNLLFQKVKGFYVNYSGDIIPQNVQNWNVQVISLERNQRFKDRQISEFLWESIERFMFSRGYK